MKPAPEPPKFSGSVPEIYHLHMGPLVFEPYAADLAAQLAASGLPAGASVLELACGTGIASRHLLGSLPAGGRLTVTDLNEPMLAIARTHLPDSPPGKLVLRVADAQVLPFPDASFDAIACQFGLMFFPDKDLAAREAMRVLRPGGLWIFSVWDSLARNPLARVAHEIVSGFFPDGPPPFYGIPFGYFDASTIEALVAGAGFERLSIEWLPKTAFAPAPAHAARGFVEGTPAANALRERGIENLSPVSEAVARVYESHFGSGPAEPISAPMQAIVVSARRPA